MNQVNRSTGERLHIGIFGRTNVGKSALINALTGQDLAIVSERPGTTTDPVRKAMELLPLGPVVLIDTAGLADGTELGELRRKKTEEVLRRCDLAILVTDKATDLDEIENEILSEASSRMPVVVVRNKADLHTRTMEKEAGKKADGKVQELFVSAIEGRGLDELKQSIIDLLQSAGTQRYLVRDLISSGDLVILVTPIDGSAPKGRLILPQQQVLRDILDAGAMGLCVQPPELPALLEKVGITPRVVITDSQAFEEVAKMVPLSIPLLSFSMIFARFKGDLDRQSKAAAKIDELSDGDLILIAEGCTHHRQCEDIGTVKLPRWLRSYTGADLRFDTISGGEFPADLSSYKLIVHCGACMLNAAEMQYRLGYAAKAGIPVTNYGTAIAKVNGLLDRCLDSFAVLTNGGNA